MDIPKKTKSVLLCWSLAAPTWRSHPRWPRQHGLPREDQERPPEGCAQKNTIILRSCHMIFRVKGNFHMILRLGSLHKKNRLFFPINQGWGWCCFKLHMYGKVKDNLLTSKNIESVNMFAQQYHSLGILSILLGLWETCSCFVVYVCLIHAAVKAYIYTCFFNICSTQNKMTSTIHGALFAT